MIPALVVFAYLAVVLYIGIFAFRTSPANSAEDYFLAGRALGPTVFLLSLFGTNMTAFSILGASGHAFANGIVTYGLMASSSALVIPVTLLVIGTRLWALGKRHGFMTRERISPMFFLSYTFIPLSSIAFPHIGIFCLTARRLGHFRKTIILYPICMLAIWLPSVFLGVVANAAREVPAIEAKLEARAELATRGAALPVEERDRLRARASGDDVILRLVEG